VRPEFEATIVMTNDWDQPPSQAIERARQAALDSPCIKSKRGVALFCRDWMRGRESYRQTVEAVACNAPPAPYTCAQSEACRSACNQVCVHAEQRVLLKFLNEVSGDRRWILKDCELVHVKVVDGQVVAGGGPSCWQCSRLVLEVAVAAVWLYEPDAFATPRWRRYTAEEFHLRTLVACGLPAIEGLR